MYNSVHQEDSDIHGIILYIDNSVCAAALIEIPSNKMINILEIIKSNVYSNGLYRFKIIDNYSYLNSLDQNFILILLDMRVDDLSP